jgi:hypothetical protein
VDLDKGTFEVYQGFNKDPLDEGERFASLPRPKDADEYHQVKHAATFPLDDLPDREAFINAFEEQDTNGEEGS